MKSQVAASFAIQPEQHLQMWRLMNRRSSRSCVFAGSLAILVVLGISATSGIDAFEAVTTVVVGLVAMATFLFLNSLTLPRRSRTVYAETASLGETQHYKHDDEGLSVSQPSGSMHLAWPDVHMWNEDRHVFLIHPNRMLALLIPKGQAGQEFVDFAKARLVRHGLPRKGKPRK